MPEYLRPGVFVQKQSSGVDSIEVVAPRRPIFYATVVTSFAEYEQHFGGLDNDIALGVYYFFLNGGKRAKIVRLLYPELSVVTIEIPFQEGAPVKISADQGTWANELAPNSMHRSSIATHICSAWNSRLQFTPKRALPPGLGP